MRRFLICVLGVAMAFGLIACSGSSGSSSSSSSEISSSESIDNQFIAAVQQGLENRYAMGENSKTAGDEKFVEGLQKRVQAEQDAVNKFSGQTFENADLGKKAETYITSLADMQSLLDIALSDTSTFESSWQSSYNTRAACLLSFVNDYGLTVSNKYQSQLDDVLSDAETIASHVDEFTIVSSEVVADPGDGYYEVKFTVQNNTDSTKNFLGFSVYELDANGNILKTYQSYNKNASYAEVAPGQQFTVSLTEKTSDGIASIESKDYQYGESISSAVKGTFSTPYVTKIV